MRGPANGTEYLTTAQTAARLGLSRAMVRKLIAQGVLRAVPGRKGRGHVTVVLLADVEAELARRRARALRQALELGVAQ